MPEVDGGPADAAGSGDDPPKRRGPRRWPQATFAALLAVGVIAVAGGGVALAQELTRHATKAEAQAAEQAEIASRWQRLPAGQIFPSQLRYSNWAHSSEHIHRIGIARPATCGQAIDPVMARVLGRAGCVTVLRATYADGPGAVVATLGIAVMPNSAAAAHAYGQIDLDITAGVRAVGFPGTMASLFGDAERQAFYTQVRGPYIFFDTDGYADGRVRTTSDFEPALGDLSGGVLGDLATIMTASVTPCREKDIQC